MDFNRQNIFQATSAKTAVWDAGLRAYMLKVYNYMATGVLLTGIISLISFKMSVVTDSAGTIASFTSFGNAIFFSGLKWVIMLAPLAIVFYMSFGINKMSAAKAQTVFLGICFFNGIIIIMDTFSLHRSKCCESIFYYISNFWSNEYLRLHN